MIAILVPCLGQPSEVFLDRHIQGMAELEPIVFTLALGKRPVEVPTMMLSSHSITANMLSRLMDHASDFWHKRVMNRPHIWEARCLGAGRKLAQHLAQSNIELVVVHFANMGTSFVSQLSCIKVPLVVICHGSEIHSARGHAPYLKRLKRLFGRADKVLCVSKYIMDEVVKYGCAPDKAEVFYLGAELPDISIPDREPRHCLRYMTTGRLSPVKGHEFLICAFAQVLSHVENAELTFIGDGILHGKLEALAHSLGIDNAVSFLGFQDNSRVYEELSKSDVYVHASYNEGLPIAIVEAMATCLPVVASNVGGIPEIVEHGATGLLVPPGDVMALAEAMVALAKDPLLRRSMGSAGRRVVEDKFDVHKQNIRCVDMLRKLRKRRMDL